ncbi:Mixed-linked glucanase [Colletotrichum higginsianum IMI 349063]|uniref:Mixed-linked glucanase n=1 Tax=Colletotrichum higginsianum (strain IMI 349063) TaxID=759273 RepID=A0A1B7YWJ1_COLHI|nr:Mixed-linked glucanase [Colletotrichum higginsianum IMI 349063]OBR16406.1 Mixed-linked glucanase [Colletotrichum higginsianum IMI 349063]
MRTSSSTHVVALSCAALARLAGGITIVPGSTTGPFVFSNLTTSSATALPAPSSTTTPSTLPSGINLPDPNIYVLRGCLGSPSGYPSFNLVGVDPEMTVQRCVSLAQGRRYAGVYNEEVPKLHICCPRSSYVRDGPWSGPSNQEHGFAAEAPAAAGSGLPENKPTQSRPGTVVVAGSRGWKDDIAVTHSAAVVVALAVHFLL